MRKKKIGKVTQLKEVTINDKYKNIKLSDGSIYGTWGTSLNQSFTITPKDYELKTLMWYAMVHFYGVVSKPSPRPWIGFHHAAGPKLIINGVVPEKWDNFDYFSLPIDRFKHIELKRMITLSGTIIYLLYLDLK